MEKNKEVNVITKINQSSKGYQIISAYNIKGFSTLLLVYFLFFYMLFIHISAFFLWVCSLLFFELIYWLSFFFALTMILPVVTYYCIFILFYWCYIFFYLPNSTWFIILFRWYCILLSVHFILIILQSFSIATIFFCLFFSYQLLYCLTPLMMDYLISLPHSNPSIVWFYWYFIFLSLLLIPVTSLPYLLVIVISCLFSLLILVCCFILLILYFLSSFFCSSLFISLFYFYRILLYLPYSSCFIILFYWYCIFFFVYCIHNVQFSHSIDAAFFFIYLIQIILFSGLIIALFFLFVLLKSVCYFILLVLHFMFIYYAQITPSFCFVDTVFSYLFHLLNITTWKKWKNSKRLSGLSKPFAKKSHGFTQIEKPKSDSHYIIIFLPQQTITNKPIIILLP